MDKDNRAAKNFYSAIRRFSEKAKTWDKDAVFYETKPDERFDLSLVSRRVYGTPDEFLAVAASASIDTFDQPLEQKTIVLPSRSALLRIKRETGFESVYDLRENGSPVWLNED